MASGYSPETPKGHYNNEVAVPEEVIQRIREMGMEQAIKEAKSGEADPEFVEGVRRFYPQAIEGIESAVEQAAPPQRDVAAPIAPPGGGENQTPTQTPAQATLAGGQQGPSPVANSAIERALEGRGGGGGNSGESIAPSPTTATPMAEGGGTPLNPAAVNRRLGGGPESSSSHGTATPGDGNGPLQLEKVIGNALSRTGRGLGQMGRGVGNWIQDHQVQR